MNPLSHHQREPMKRLRPLCAWMLCLAGTILFVSSVSAEIQNRVVAIVNNEVVTLHELNTRIRELTGIPPSELKRKSEEVYLEARRKVLDDLIDQKIALEKIKADGIKMVAVVFFPHLKDFYEKAGFKIVSGGLIDNEAKSGNNKQS